MELSIGTPALLFSTVSLLMIAFTNRFMSMASLIRDLHKKFQKNPDEAIVMQIDNLRIRMKLIQRMQIIAIISLILSVICMFLLFMNEQLIARWFFGVGLLGMSIALALSAWEITISTKALEVELSDMEEIINKRK
jgi:Trk-type K+ transport system membrane component